MKINELELPIRLYNFLARNEIQSVEDLLQTDWTTIQMRGCGKATVAELLNLLTRLASGRFADDMADYHRRKGQHDLERDRKYIKEFPIDPNELRVMRSLTSRGESVVKKAKRLQFALDAFLRKARYIEAKAEPSSTDPS